LGKALDAAGGVIREEQDEATDQVEPPMEAYIERGEYQNDFDGEGHISRVADREFVQQEWDSALVPNDQEVVLVGDEALHLYGGKASLVQALRDTHDSVGSYRIRSRHFVPLMVAYASVTLDGGRRKRVLMICEYSEDRAAEIGADNLLADSNGNTSFETLSELELIEMIERLPGQAED
jgi:hypothetical protein